ncbi:MAG: MBL fold metallo-hydrolase [Prevotella sp.]|jgi:phosphoribosyl 1,2-cyclic phosphodiesterase
MLHYISFGSGSSGNCSYLFTEKYGILLDAGVGIRMLKKNAKNYGLNLSDIHHILITHDHSDHIRCVGGLSHDYNLPVYATSKVHEGIRKSWCVKHNIDPSLVKVIQKDTPFKLDDFTITPFGVPHDSMDNVGYCIEYQNITFVLMTDVGHLTEEMKTFIGRANYLVIEADFEKEKLLTGRYSQVLKERILSPTGHMSNEECGLAIAENATPALRHVWLCHLSDENNHPVLAEKTVKTILESYGLKVGKQSGADFQLDVLKRNTPSGIYDLI